MDGIFDAVGREGVLGDAEMMSWVDKNRKWLDAYAGFKVQMAKERSKFGSLPGKGVGMICGKHACSHALAPASRGGLICRAQSASSSTFHTSSPRVAFAMFPGLDGPCAPWAWAFPQTFVGGGALMAAPSRTAAFNNKWYDCTTWSKRASEVQALIDPGSADFDQVAC